MPSRVVRQQFSHPCSGHRRIRDNPLAALKFDRQTFDTELRVVLVPSSGVGINADTSIAQELDKVHLCGVGFHAQTGTVSGRCGLQPLHKLWAFPSSGLNVQNLPASVGEKNDGEDRALIVLGTLPYAEVNATESSARTAVAFDQHGPHVLGILESALNPISFEILM